MAEENPYSAPAQRVDRASDAAGSGFVRPLLEPLYGARVWMQIVAAVLILGAVFMILGSLIAFNLIGLLIAVIVGWMAWALNKAATTVVKAYRQEDERLAKVAMVALATYFRIIGIITLVYILVIVAVIAFGFTLPFMRYH